MEEKVEAQEIVRYLGFVVAYDMHGDDKVWKVKVRKPGAQLDGKKFVVAEVTKDATLSRGMDVSFLLCEFQRGRQTVLKAVDVRPYVHNPEAGEVVAKCDECGAPAEILFKAGDTKNRARDLVRTCLPHLALFVNRFRAEIPVGRRDIKFINVYRDDKDWRRWPETGDL